MGHVPDNKLIGLDWNRTMPSRRHIAGLPWCTWWRFVRHT